MSEISYDTVYLDSGNVIRDIEYDDFDIGDNMITYTLNDEIVAQIFWGKIEAFTTSNSPTVVKDNRYSTVH